MVDADTVSTDTEYLEDLTSARLFEGEMSDFRITTGPTVRTGVGLARDTGNPTDDLTVDSWMFPSGESNVPRQSLGAVNSVITGSTVRSGWNNVVINTHGNTINSGSGYISGFSGGGYETPLGSQAVNEILDQRVEDVEESIGMRLEELEQEVERLRNVVDELLEIVNLQRSEFE